MAPLKQVYYVVYNLPLLRTGVQDFGPFSFSGFVLLLVHINSILYITSTY